MNTHIRVCVGPPLSCTLVRMKISESSGILACGVVSDSTQYERMHGKLEMLLLYAAMPRNKKVQSVFKRMCFYSTLICTSFNARTNLLPHVIANRELTPSPVDNLLYVNSFG